MSYATEIIKPGSHKITLVELDMPISVSTWQNYAPGIWMIVLNPGFGEEGTVTVTDDDGVTGWFEYDGDLAYKRIGSLKVNGEIYTQQTAMVDLVSTNKSWYYDSSTYGLYVHFDSFDHPCGYNVRMGEIHGFCDRPATAGAYYDDIYYDPRLLTVGNLKKSKDPINFGILQYSNGSVVLNNSDGEFDAIADRDIWGQPVRIYMGFDGLSFSDFRQVFTGAVDKFSVTQDKLTLNLSDYRKFLTRKIPIKKFNSTDFPNISDDLNGQPRPLIYGAVRNIPCPCVNSEASASTWQFFVGDMIDGNYPGTITTVYLNGIATASYSYSNGIISIADGVSVAPATEDAMYIEDNLDGVTCDCTGYTNDKGTEIIRYTLQYAAYVPYNTTFFDTTEWTAEDALSHDMGIYINEEIEIKELIEKVCISDGRIFLVKDDGTYTTRSWDSSRATSKTIYTDEWLDEPSVNYDAKDALSSVKIEYDKNYSDDTFKSIRNVLYETGFFRRFGWYRENSYETYLVSEADANSKADDVMTRTCDIFPTVTRKTKINTGYVSTAADLEVMDFVQAEHGRDSDTTKPWAIYELIGIDKNLQNYELTLTMKYVRDV